MGSCVGLLIYKLFVGCSLSARVLSGTFYIVYNQQANINILYPLVTMLYKRFKHFFIKTHCIVISCSFSYKMSTFFNLYFSLQNIPIPLPAPKRRQKCYLGSTDAFHSVRPLFNRQPGIISGTMRNRPNQYISLTVALFTACKRTINFNALQ